MSSMKTNKKVYVTAFCGISIAVNIVLGIITISLGIPLYLDTLGTVLVAALVGPLPGAVVGALTNIITGLMYSVTDIPFCLVSIAVALIVGFTVKKFKFTLPVAVILGLVLSVVSPVIGTPIGIFVYGGLNGSFSDVLVMGLVQSGQSIFAASFLRNIASNLVDKVGTLIIAWAIVKWLPMSIMQNFKKEN